MADLFAKPGSEPRIFIEDGRARVLSHDGSEELISALSFPHHLNEAELSFFSGALLRERMIDVPMPPHELAKVLDVSDIRLGEIPTTPVLKLMQNEFAKGLCEKGALRLGTIDYYRRFNHAQIGDPDEGHCVIACYHDEGTTLFEVRQGLNDYMFCCFSGDEDPRVIEDFEYDTAVLISNPAEFARIIATHLRSKEAQFGKCLYVRDRAVFGKVEGAVEAQLIMDGGASRILGIAPGFLKDKRLSNQSEFRFIWRMGHTVEPFIDIQCPEVSELCSISE